VKCLEKVLVEMEQEQQKQRDKQPSKARKKNHVAAAENDTKH
jgi:hypothetical protein